MISPFRILEILICSLATFLPYVLLTVYPFRKNLRFGGAATAAFTAVAAIAQFGCNLVFALDLLESPGFVRLAALLIHVLLFLLVVRASAGKKLFVLLTAINVSLIVSMAADSLEAVLFPTQSELMYQWTDLIVVLSQQALFLIPCLIIMVKFLSPALGRKGRAPFGWLWLLPAAVFVIWVLMVGFSTPEVLILMVSVALTAIALLIAAVSVLKYLAAAASKLQRQQAQHVARNPQTERPSAPKYESQPAAPRITETREDPAPQPAEAAPAHQDETIEAPAPQSAEAAPTRQAEPRQQTPVQRRTKSGTPTPQLQVLQHGNLMERISESDQFHQELRRHIDAMAYRLERKQYEKLHLHVHSLQEQLSDETQVSYCENKELNSVIAYFVRMAGYCGTHVTANLQIAEDPAIPTRDLTVLLGNLLDHALDICKKQAGFNRRIFAAVHTNGGALYLNVENTCDAPVQAAGVGMSVCKQIANLYNGTLELNNIDGIFKATAILRPAQRQAASNNQLHALQYGNLMERISESDQFHRELHRHVDAMAYRLERKQYEKLHQHVHSLQEQLSSESQASHCENAELNSVISYFTRMAGYCGAQVTANLQVPSNPAIPTKNLTVLLGNLLDNALDTCKKQSGFDRRIFAAVHMNGSALYLNVENTCDTPVQGTGVGMSVCKQIATLYNGTLETSNINGVFKATVILRP